MATIPCIRCGAQIDREFKACPHCGEPLTDFLREYADKPIDGKYRIVQRLGIGGMGEVFKVEHTFLGSTRVVKIIRAQISSSSDAHERFLREARMATKVQHPNVATLYDFSALPDGSHYMVWEFIEGQNLAQVLKQRGTLAPRHAVRIAIQALAGLEAIHRAGIVHRDISPENLMITHAGEGSEFVKIIDLGVAKAAESDVAMTQTGMFVGKFRYASPDHLGFVPAGERIDGRADLYSLGVVLFEMLTGRAPFEATSPHEYIIHHSRDEYATSPDLDRITGNPALQTVLARALDRDRNKRFATAREFSEALAAIEATLPDEPPALPATAVFDPDATMKTERTKGGQTIAPSAAAAPPTVITPTPPPPPLVPSVTREATVPARPPSPPAPPHVDAPPTLVDPMPMPPAAPSRNTGTIIAVSIIVLLFLGAIGAAGVMAFMKFRNSFSGTTTATTASTATTLTTPAATAKPSQTSVDVTPPASVLVDTATTAATTTTIAPATTSSAAVVPPPTATHAPVKPKPPVVAEPAPVEETPAPEPQPEPEPAPSSVPTFRERGDGSANDSAIATLHQQIGGVTRVAVTGGDAEMINELSNALRGRGISIGEGAPIEIRFTGSVNRHGLGRKSRSANATVKKNGRPIFNYLMPREEYRVGDSPAEAFARILTDALAR
ncbi:MAG: eukaryotic-like serine/threonine-protein kinase [Thermoanaerobaculia bacterium]|jgi:serine/threonine-protein kinase|nr:eukaryotic-like serine/threonine-protein kinase [Thermoanaerobaculia bacterium]